MPDFTVVRHGTDPNGRAIFLTRYMQDWWKTYVAALGFTPTIVQGAFMSRNGGGASASAGYHDLGGCLDLRVWDKTEAQRKAMVRKARARGAAAWIRDERHGMDPHLHLLLGSDSPLASGAATQWQQYLRGENGLANRGKDYHWRPNPLVTKPPVTQAPTPKPEPKPEPKPAPSKGLPVHGVDISHHQAGAIDWAAAKKAGVQWVYHKATEGATVTDANYARRRVEAAAAGIPFGAYSFARPEGNDARAEAEHFLRVAQPKPGDLRPCLDLEVEGGLNSSRLQAWAAEWIAVVEKATGVKPVVYTPYDLGPAVKGCVIWRPRYNDDNRPPVLPYDIHQFSNGVLGVPNKVAGFGNVDLNTMRAGLTTGDLLIPQPEPEGTFLFVATVNAWTKNPAQAAGLTALIAAARNDSGCWLDIIGVQEANELLDHDEIVVKVGDKKATYDVVPGDPFGLAMLIKRGRRIRPGRIAVIKGANAIETAAKNNHHRGILERWIAKQGTPFVPIVTHMHLVNEAELARKNDQPETWPLPGRAHATHAGKVVGIALQHIESGRVPIVLADSNAGVKSKWTGTLANHMREAGFTVEGHKIDLVAAPEACEVEFRKTYPARLIGGDHDAVVVGLRVV